MRLPIRHPGDVSFAVQVHLRRGATPDDEARFQRRTEDWLALHDLSADGAQTSFAILANRELSTIDQADVLLAMLDDLAVRQARVGPLVTHGDGLAEAMPGPVWVVADRHDWLLHAARTLYLAGRLDGSGFLEALGGFVFRLSEQSEAASEDKP
jgi:hypothetical protein